MSNRIIISALSIVVLIIGAGWYYTKNKTVPVPTSEPIKIGVIAPLTGVAADYGEEIKKGLSSIENKNITFIYEDDKCDPKEAVSAFKKLTEIDGVKFIIGPGCGSPQEAIVPLAKEKGIVILVPSAASKDLYARSGNNFFNVQYSLEDESKFVAEKMTAAGYKKIALVEYRNAFSDTHAKSFKANFKGEIVDVVLTDATSDIAPALAKIKAAKVNAIYSPDVSFFFGSGVVKLTQLGVTVPIYGTYVTELPAVRALVPNVLYSFAGDLPGQNGAVYELAKQAGEILISNIETCQGAETCVKDKLAASGQFDNYGVYKRNLLLKQIKGDKVEVVK